MQMNKEGMEDEKSDVHGWEGIQFKIIVHILNANAIL